MLRPPTKVSGENTFKRIVRAVVKEELALFEKNFDVTLSLTESRIVASVDEKIETSFKKCRDDVVTKLDKLVGEIKT